MIRSMGLLLALCWLTACTGDRGPTGPAGPSGAQGERGFQGLPGNVEAFALIEHTVTARDYTTGSGLLILDGRISLASYLQTYVTDRSLPFPAYVPLDVFAERELEGRPHVAVFAGGLAVFDSGRELVGHTLTVAVLPAD